MIPSRQPTLFNDFQLRLIEPDDAPGVADYYQRNEPSHREWSPVAPPEFFTSEYQRNRIAAHVDRRERGEEFRFAIVPRNDTERVIGLITLSAIERGAFQNGRFGYSIDAEYYGKGIMTTALRAVIRWSFEELSLHRLEANIMPRNIASRRVLEKCGFTKFGHSPRMVNIKGVWEDHDLYMMLSDEFG